MHYREHGIVTAWEALVICDMWCMNEMSKWAEDKANTREEVMRDEINM